MSILRIFVGLYCCVFASSANAFSIESYYGQYQVNVKQPYTISSSLTGPETESWSTPLAAKKYKIAVLLPHLKDNYWRAINYGIMQEAKKLNIEAIVLDASGYANLDTQKTQLTENILQEKVDGVLLAPVSYDALDTAVAKLVKAGIPIVSIVNDIHAPHITAKVASLNSRLGRALANFVLEDALGKDIKVAFFPGPEKAAWAKETFKSFVKTLEQNPDNLPVRTVTIVAEQYGNLNKSYQNRLVAKVLEVKPGINYLIGNALAVREAIDLMPRYQKDHPDIKLLATYMLPEIYDLIEKEKIYAAATDSPLELGKLSLGVLVRALNGEQPGDKKVGLPFQASTIVHVLAKRDLQGFAKETIFGELFDSRG